MKSFGQRRSQLQEKRIAKEIGGRVQPASGAGKHAKGDVRGDGILIEAKTTSKSEYVVKLKELKKIAGETLDRGFLMWALQLEFQSNSGQNKKYAILDGAMFHELYTKHPTAGLALVGMIPTSARQVKVRLEDMGTKGTWVNFAREGTVNKVSYVYMVLPWSDFTMLWETYQAKYGKGGES